MIDIKLQLMTGVDIPIPELEMVIHQPTIEEISFMGEPDFFLAANFLAIDKGTLMNMGEKVDLSSYKIFLEAFNSKELQDKKDIILSLFSLMIVDKKTIITPNGILLMSKDGNGFPMNEDTFEIFQNVVKTILCVSNEKSKEQLFNPKGDRAKGIAEKIMKGREKAASQRGTDSESVLARYCSILAVGLGLDIKILTHYTIYQIYDLLERFGLYSEQDLDIRVRLAGGNPNGETGNWMKNIH